MFNARRQRHMRADVSLVENVIALLTAARSGTGTPVPYDELPVTQGACMLIADCVASFPLYAVDLDDVRTGERFPVLEQPNPEEDRGETVHKIAQSMYWTGNAYALNGPRDPSSGAVDAITVLNPNSVGHFADPADELRIQSWQINGRGFTRTELTLWKLNDDPRRGPLGRSPLQRCSTALDTYGWAYRYLGDYFANGGNPGSVLSSSIDMTPDKIAELSDEWIAARQRKRPAFLPKWLDFEIPPSSGELAQVVAVLEFGAAEFARLMNLPVSLVNAPVAGYTLTYTNVGDEFRRWLVTNLGTTWIRRLERGFSGLLPADRRARLDTAALFALDPETPAPSRPASGAVPADA